MPMRQPPWEFSPVPGVTMPGQFGPMRRVLLPCMAAFTFIMSMTGMPSVMQTTRSRPASTPSRIASAGEGRRHEDRGDRGAGLLRRLRHRVEDRHLVASCSNISTPPSIRVGEHRLARFDLERDRLVMGCHRHHPRAGQMDIEETTADHRSDPLHHLDLVRERRFEGEHVIAVDENLLVLQADDADLLALIGEVQLPLTVRVGDAAALARHRLLQQIAYSLIEHLLTGELDAAPISHHRAHLGVDPTVEVHFEQSLGFFFKQTVTLVLLLGGAEKLVEAVCGRRGGEPTGQASCGRFGMPRRSAVWRASAFDPSSSRALICSPIFFTSASIAELSSRPRRAPISLEVLLRSAWRACFSVSFRRRTSSQARTSSIRAAARRTWWRGVP